MKKKRLHNQGNTSTVQKNRSGGVIHVGEKEYRSAVRSRELIHEAMLDLICEKNLNDITIKEVVGRARINRSTFYAHYSNLGELVEEIEQELLEYLKEQISSREQAVSPELVAKHIVGLFEAFPQCKKKQKNNFSFIEFMYHIFNRYIEMCLQVVPLSQQEDPSFCTRLQLTVNFVFFQILQCDSGLWNNSLSYSQTIEESLYLCRKL